MALAFLAFGMANAHGQVERENADGEQEDVIPAHVLLAYRDSSTGLYGYMAGDGRSIKTTFQEARGFGRRYAVVKADGAWGVIDTTGRFVLEAKYAHVMPPVDDRTVAIPKGTPDACVIELGLEAKCVPFGEYWRVWSAQLRASALPDKELIIRVLEMRPDHVARQEEIVFLEGTYVLMDEVRTRAMKELLGK